MTRERKVSDHYVEHTTQLVPPEVVLRNVYLLLL